MRLKTETNKHGTHDKRGKNPMKPHPPRPTPPHRIPLEQELLTYSMAPKAQHRDRKWVLVPCEECLQAEDVLNSTDGGHNSGKQGRSLSLDGWPV